MTNNQIQYANYLESVRAHKASEDVEGRKAGAQESQARTAAATQQETARHNMEQELVNWFSAGTDRDYKTGTLEMEQAKLAETTRANQARELETKLHNKAQESVAAKQQAEVRRHNEASERIDIGKTVIQGITGVAQGVSGLAKAITLLGG